MTDQQADPGDDPTANLDRPPDTRVHGIGGVFLRCPDPGATRAWYQRHLGLTVDAYGTSFSWRRNRSPDAKGFTLWAPFDADTDYFGDSGQEFMVNFRVDDLDGLLDRLRADGVEVIGQIEEMSFGRFAHFVDNDGRRVELWEPIDDVYDAEVEGITPS